MKNEVAIRKTVEEYCAIRDVLLDEYQAVLTAESGLEQKVRGLVGLTGPRVGRGRLDIAQFRCELDAALWRRTLDMTGLPRYMDAKARNDFERGLETNPAAYTEENVRATLVGAAASADDMFARGLVELFRIRTDHATNRREPFRLPRKVIWGGIVDVWSGKMQVNYQREDLINDLDRVFSTLAGEPFEPRALQYALNATWGSGEDTYEDALFKIRGFRNGNVHVWLLRSDLVGQANRIIADYVGAVLADAGGA